MKLWNMQSLGVGQETISAVSSVCVCLLMLHTVSWKNLMFFWDTVYNMSLVLVIITGKLTLV